jgi:hypothetical protein
MAASNPPADPPMPTIGQLNCFFGVFARAVWRGGLERTDFLRLDFVRESRARRFGVRFAVMSAFYVNCGVPMTQASIAA